MLQIYPMWERKLETIFGYSFFSFFLDWIIKNKDLIYDFLGENH